MNTIYAADLFAGAGGATTSLMQAAKNLGREASVVAVNHWPVAVTTHKTNYPGHFHHCESVRAVSPREAVPSGRLDILLAGPSCVHFSNARGGAPMNEQERASAWDVFKWCEQLDIESVLIENVPEFISWGPLDAAGRPIRNGLGQEFARFIGAMTKLGYNVEWRVVCAAHYGDATTRKRLFIQARRGPITWPAPTHYAPEVAALNDCPAWRTAREIIDWSLPSKSIFNRKKRLAGPTMQRIYQGMVRFWPQLFAYGPLPLDAPIPLDILPCDPEVSPFLIKYYGGHNAATIDAPLGTVTANYEHYGLIEPFIIRYHGGKNWNRSQSIDSPIGVQDGSNRYGLVEPFLVVFRNNCDGRSLDSPLPAVCTSRGHFGLIQPFLISYHGNGTAHDIEHPLPTQTGADRFGLVEPIPDGAAIDLRLRMLQPKELSAAHSFPEDYWFAGNREDIVKQIGNSWPVRTGTAIVGEILKTRIVA